MIPEPGKKVANLFAMNDVGGSGFVAPFSRFQAVLWRKRKTKMIERPSRPTVHQNSRVHDRFAAMKAESVGPATLPKLKNQWKTVKARPR